MKQILLMIAMGTLGVLPGCGVLSFNKFRGVKPVEAEINAPKSKVSEALLKYMKNMRFERIRSADGSTISGTYRFRNTITESMATAQMSQYTEAMGRFLNPYGQNCFAEIELRLNENTNDKTKLIIEAHFKTFGVPEGVGGIGPFSMNSKGVWEDDFIHEFKKAIDGQRLGSSASPAVKFGTGFFVSSDGYILTNEHVVRNASKFQIILRGKKYSAKIIKSDRANDIALIKIDGSKLPFLTLGDTGNAKLGSNVFTVGFPNIDLQGKSPKLTKGAVNSLKGIRDDSRYFQVSIPIQPGNSGGPLVSENGKVIGIVTSKLSDLFALKKTGSLPQNVNYAIKIEYAKILLKGLPLVESGFDPTKSHLERAAEAVVIIKAN